MATVGTLQVNITGNLAGLQTTINRANSLINNFANNNNRATVNINANAQNLQNTVNNAQNSVNRLTNSTNTVNISGNASGVMSAISAVGSGLTSLGQKAEAVGKKMTMALTVPIAMLGKKMISAGMDAVESENLFDVSLGKMAGQARSWSKSVSNSLGLNEVEMRKNVGTLDTMLKSMGIAEQGAYKMSTSMTVLAQDMASFYNIKPEEAFLKLQSGISGEAEPLKRLGILVTDNTIQQYALRNGLIKTGEQMTEQQKVIARYGAIMDATKASQEDLARTLDSPANKLRMLKTQWDNLCISMGQLILPVVSAVIGKINEFIMWINNLDNSTKKIILIVAGVVASIGPLLIILGILGQVIGGLITLLPILSSVFAFLISPIGLVIVAIVGLIGYLIYLYNTNKEVANKINVVWDMWGGGIIALFKGTWDIVVNVVNVALTLVKNIIMLVLDLITGNWSGAWTDITNIFMDFGNGLVNIGNGIGQMFINIWNNVKVSVTYIWTSIVGNISICVNKIANCFWCMMSKVGAGLTSFSQKVSSFYNSVADKIGMEKVSWDWGSSLTNYSNNKIATNLETIAVDRKKIEYAKVNLEQFKLQKRVERATRKAKYSKLDNNAPAKITPNYGKLNLKDPSLINPNFVVPKPPKKQKVKKPKVPKVKKPKKATAHLKKAKKDTDAVTKSVENLTKKIGEMAKSFDEKLGVFDKFIRKFVNMQTLLNRGKMRANAFKDWQKYQNELMGRSELNTQTRTQIAGMGVDRLAELRALATADADDLRAWNNYVTEASNISRQQAGNNTYQIDINVDSSNKNDKEIAQRILNELKRRGVNI